jgi:polyferredoxin
MTEFQKADLNGDGSVSEREMEIYLEAKRREMEDADAERDLARQQAKERYEQQSRMVWFALAGLLLYPTLVFGTEALGYSNASSVIADMAPTYFMAVSIVVGAFFGADAYVKGKSNKDGNDG